MRLKDLLLGLVLVLATVQFGFPLHLINGLLILEDEADQIRHPHHFLPEGLKEKRFVRVVKISENDESDGFVASDAITFDTGDHSWTENFINKQFKIKTHLQDEPEDLNSQEEEEVEEEKVVVNTTKPVKKIPKRSKEATSVTSPTMDIITIIWYFSTFVALIAFFVVMACSDNYCGRGPEKPEENQVTAPPTPAPSYREFAPPSYDTVMKKYKNRVFIIPLLNENGELKPFDDSMQPTGASNIVSSSSSSTTTTDDHQSTLTSVVVEIQPNQTHENVVSADTNNESGRF